MQRGSTKKRMQDDVDDFDADYDNLEVGDIASGFTPYLPPELYPSLKSGSLLNSKNGFNDFS